MNPCLSPRPIMAPNRGGPTTNRRQKTRDKTKTPLSGTESGVLLKLSGKEELLVLGRPGSDLLSQGLSHSTIGAEEFNGRVRDGIGFKLLARTTRPAKDKDTKQAETLCVRARSPDLIRGPTLELKRRSLRMTRYG